MIARNIFSVRANPGAVGRRVRALREAMSLTQVQLAGLADLSQPTISSLERGDTKSPEADTILRIALALHCTPYYLLWDDHRPSVGEPAHGDMIDAWAQLSAGQRMQLAAYAQGLVDAGRLQEPEEMRAANHPLRRATDH